jgi:hypothetical protein
MSTSSRKYRGRLTSRRSPGSRACCFSACAGSQTTQDRTIHSRLAWLSCCLPPLGTELASCSIGFSKLNGPAHRYLCLRFKRHLAMSPARLEARMDSLLSFPVGLFHPLQHAGLSRRSPSGRPSFPYRLENVATDELKELHSQREEAQNGISCLHNSPAGY